MLNRRQLLRNVGYATASILLPFKSQSEPGPEQDQDFPESIDGTNGSYAPGFIYCLNMATLRGHKLGFMKELEIASRAGFPMVEIWIESLQQYLREGGTIPEVRKRLNTLGITIANSIGFAKWIVDDEAVRKLGIEQTKKEMDLLAEVGCKRIAAPPMGATETAGLDLKRAAERYRVILELGDKSGVVPQLELWGFSKNLCRLSEVMYVAIESGHPSARVLLDVYHLYKGGSDLSTLPLMAKSAVEILHMNDYTNMERSVITDADRIHPGDGIAPVKKILSDLKNPAKPLIISEEVFNAVYYKQDPLVVAKTAISKMKKIVETL